MANVQWAEIPFAMTSLSSQKDSGGNLIENEMVLFNAFLDGSTTGPQCLLDPDKCQMGSAKRVTRDNTPQQGGEIMHKHFKTGIVVQLGGIYANVKTINTSDEGVPSCEMEPLCGTDLVALDDLLMLNLDAMENVDGSVTWIPDGYPKMVAGPPPLSQPGRAVYATRWLGPDGLGGAAFTAVLTEREDQIFVGWQFALVSPFPYAVDASEIETPLGGSSPVTVNNTGTTPFFPVIEISAVGGDVSSFVLHNNTTDLLLQYAASLPGAAVIPDGQFVEFDFFRNTAYFNRDGANAKPGIYVPTSDFWSLVPGDNTIELDGEFASGVMKWQASYV